MRLDINIKLFEDEQFRGAGEEELLGRGLHPDQRHDVGGGRTMILTGIREEELLYWDDLTEEEQADLENSYSDVKESTFFRYGGHVYDLNGFMRSPANSDLADYGWDGFESSSYWGGVVVRFDDSGDGVIVANVHWEDDPEYVGESKDEHFKGASKKEASKRAADYKKELEKVKKSAESIYYHALKNHKEWWDDADDFFDGQPNFDESDIADMILDNMVAEYDLDYDTHENIIDQLGEMIFNGLT